MTRVLFVVPARGGSQRIPGKNLLTVAGIPLVGAAARLGRRAAARLPGGPHLVVCSTDDPAIAEAALAWGAHRVLDRPAELATATATSADVVRHAIETLATTDAPFDAVVLLQPTVPLTRPADIVAAVERFASDAALWSVVGVILTHPKAWHLGHDRETGILSSAVDPVAARIPDALLNGAVYVVDPARFRLEPRFVVPGETVGIVIAADLSVDIDEPADLAIAEALAAARPVRPVPFGSRALGDGPVFVIAEAGVNHDGRVVRAHALIDAAADTGADAVKFQTFDPATIAAPATPTAAYQQTAGEGDDQRAMLARLTLPADAWPELQVHAHERGLVFLSTPFDLAAATLLDRLDVPGFKVGSGELTNLPFLRRLAAFGRPLLISTGMAELREVAVALDAVADAGDPPVALFHCVSSYPAAPEDANLRAITTMRAAFGVPVGWSDHTPGIELPLAAVALGASMVEKHLTLDRTAAGPDHRASLEPAAFTAMVTAIRTVDASMGDGVKRPVAAELSVAAVARRSLHWARALERGAPITEADLVALRPASGLAPGALDRLVGRRTARSVGAGALVDPADVSDIAETGGLATSR